MTLENSFLAAGCQQTAVCVAPPSWDRISVLVPQQKRARIGQYRSIGLFGYHSHLLTVKMEINVCCTVPNRTLLLIGNRV